MTLQTANTQDRQTKADRPVMIGTDVGERIVSLREARAILGNISPSTLRRWRLAGELPAPVRIGPRRIGYPLSVLQRRVAEMIGGAMNEAA
jgi:predicted DNA-binding transcriptional regulator AlpA